MKNLYKSIDIQVTCTYTLDIGTRYSYLKGGDFIKNHRLIEARKQKKLNQEQLAQMLGFKGKQSVANWENGHSTPTLSTAIAISRVLERDVIFLFGNQVQDTHTINGSSSMLCI